MTATEATDRSETEQQRCGCCGRTMPVERLARLGSTPGVYICSGCGLWAARRASHLPDLADLTSLARRGLDLLRRNHSHEHESGHLSVIPILPSHDLERTILFWRALGFTVVERFGDYLVTAADHVEIHFTSPAPNVAEEVPAGNHPGQVFIHVQDAAALWKQLQAAQVSGVGSLEDMDHGLREFVVTDPDGNRIRFGSPLD